MSSRAKDECGVPLGTEGSSPTAKRQEPPSASPTRADRLERLQAQDPRRRSLGSYYFPVSGQGARRREVGGCCRSASHVITEIGEALN